jgi:hypothetical protein
MTPTNQRAVELAPCPFCNGPGKFTKKRFGGTGASGMEPYTVFAGCDLCGCKFSGGNEEGWASGRGWFDRSAEAHAEAAAAWNRRTPGWRPISEEQVERMVDHVLGTDDGGCPLCEYDGLWNTRLSGDEDRRHVIRDLIEKALSTLPPPPGEG